MHQLKKYSSSLLLSFNVNLCTYKVYLKYTFEFNNKYINFQSLLQVYFWLRKEIQLHFKNMFKVYLKYTSSNSWRILSILEHINLNNFPIIFIKLQPLEVKISPKVYLEYTSYLEYGSIIQVELNVSNTL